MKFGNIIRSVIAASVVALGLTAAPKASAVTVDSVGDSFGVNYADAGLGLNATVTYSVTTFDTTLDKIVFNVGIVNNSTLATDRLTSFAVEVLNPVATSASASNGWSATTNDALAGTNVDLCLWDGSNCNGGGNGGIAGAGGTGSFVLTLNFSNLTSAGLGLSGFDSKFQTGVGSFHLGGCLVGDTRCTPPPPSKVPEPATLALFGLGLMGVGLTSRRRRVQGQ